MLTLAFRGEKERLPPMMQQAETLVFLLYPISLSALMYHISLDLSFFFNVLNIQTPKAKLAAIVPQKW